MILLSLSPWIKRFDKTAYSSSPVGWILQYRVRLTLGRHASITLPRSAYFTAEAGFAGLLEGFAHVV
jgi:hypothetical protein